MGGGGTEKGAILNLESTHAQKKKKTHRQEPSQQQPSFTITEEEWGCSRMVFFICYFIQSYEAGAFMPILEMFRVRISWIAVGLGLAPDL